MSRSPQPGDVLGDRYRVIEVVGSGGMGVVYRAQNVVTAKYVALKWLRPLFASGAGGERLLREARAASLLKHPHIVDVYDLTKDTASDTWVLVMELLQGETLRQYILRSSQARPSTKLSTFIALLLPAVEAVVAAHELGIVHRDLKPENIFLERVPHTKRVVPKVLDFGIAKLNDPRERTLTVTGTTLGTPFYMAPEQYHGDRDIDARTDVYAFGAMLYEAITGRMPHAASSLPELALKVTTKAAEPVKSLCPNLPSSLARLVDAALALNKEDRLPTLKLLHDELELFAQEHSFRSEMTLGGGSVPNMAVPAVTAETLAETRLGVCLDDRNEINLADKTPAPTSKTRDTGARSLAFAGQSGWIAWSLLALTVVTSLVLYWQRVKLEESSRHAALQLPAVAVVAENAMSAADSSESDGQRAARECLTAEEASAAAPQLSAAVAADRADVARLPPSAASNELATSMAKKRTDAERSQAAKLKNHKQEPAPSEAGPPADPKRSISKILAF
jgi:serine/threonine protein kinase